MALLLYALSFFYRYYIIVIVYIIVLHSYYIHCIIVLRFLGDLIELEDAMGENCLQVAMKMEHKSCARTLFLFQVIV